VAFSESPFDEQTLYVGSDDGLIHITEDGGETWRKMDSFPGIPRLIYTSAVLASRHDPDRVYVLFNNHKRGDFTPYVLRSDDRGRSWTSIAGNLPDRHVLWDIIEDPENPDLLFLGTEFGVFTTLNGGEEWFELGDLPTIPVRDMEIHEGMGDLVLGTFGRGLYVMDDYTPLRGMAQAATAGDAMLFSIRDAYTFQPIQYYSAGSGAGNYTAPNPPFGAILNYYLPSGSSGEDVVLVVRDEAGALVAEVEGDGKRGLNRAIWNLRARPPEPEEGEPQRSRRRQGPLVEPGIYTVTLEARVGEASRTLGEAQQVRVVPLAF
jgi:hypothetical protein